MPVPTDTTHLSDLPSQRRQPRSARPEDNAKRRRAAPLLYASLLLGGLLATGCQQASTSNCGGGYTATENGERWLSAWGTTWESSNSFASTPSETTVRNIARVTAGGSAVRLRFFNLDPDRPVTIGAAAVGIRQSGTDATLQPGTNQPVTFDCGQPDAVIPPNTASYYSDPIALQVSNQDDVAVSLHVVGDSNPPQFGTAWNESYRRPNDSGDSTMDESGDGFGLIDGNPGQFPPGTPVRCNGCRPYALRDIEVRTTEADGVMTFLGSSSFHGANSSQDGFKRVTDLISVRIMNELPAGQRHTVVNRSISGDTLEAAFRDRMERDIWSTVGLASVVVWVTNDLAERSADAIIANYRELISEARMRGVKVFCPTWLPGAQNIPSSLNGERAMLNDWILNSGECDGVVDYNAVVEAPGGLTFQLQYNSGDSIHVNDAGHAAWAEATPVVDWIARGRR